MLGVILLNTVTMALDSYDPAHPGSSSEVLEFFNNAWTTVFIIEAAVKISAFSFLEYIREPWHLFDFTIVLSAVLDWIVQLAAAELGTNPTLLRTLRIVRLTRILRTLRIIKSARSLRMLLSMLVLSLPALVNILGIFLVLLVVYSLLGMQIFGGLPHGEYINSDANFCTFAYALLTMFRCATGEEWNGIMHEAMASSVGPWVAVPYFVSYVLLSTYIVLKVRGW